METTPQVSINDTIQVLREDGKIHPMKVTKVQKRVIGQNVFAKGSGSSIRVVYFPSDGLWSEFNSH
ncbi:MAG: hypothetical protein Unbinned3891contig1000_39 [Prokaryotic dsDNA virus sp.]|nr:MAG: hypothetical protein Unbinned3891contig1000_39 [Prokaryotic dsDNA virus sp.]